MGRAGQRQGINTPPVPPVPEILTLFALPMLLVASAFFSGAETALFRLSHHQRLRLGRSRTLAGATITALLANPRAILITLLVANNTVNVAYFVISTVLLLRLKGQYHLSPVSIALLTVAFLVSLILLGEVLPKLLATRLSMQWSRLTALPLMAIHRAMTPLRAGFEASIITPLARLIAPPVAPPDLSGKELEAILEQSCQRGVIDHDEEQLLQQVLELGQLKVRDLMTPRVDIEAFDLSQKPSRLLEQVRTTRFSRIPVYTVDLDHIEGMILTRQLLLSPPRSPQALRDLIRQVAYVPDLQRADQLLVHFRKTGTTCAIAVDEYGGTAGLITLEDVVEHMVGQIAGPHEPRPEPQVQQVQPDRWRVSADLPVHEWVDLFSQYPAMAALPVTAGVTGAGVCTLGGLVMAALGRLPVVGDTTTIGNIVIEVQQMQGRRIQWLTVRLQHDETAAQPNPTGQSNATEIPS